MADKKGKYIFGICKVSDKGQIVIPKEARDVFKINAGDNLILLGDEKKGLALVKSEVFTSVTENILGLNGDNNDSNKNN